MSKLFKLEVDNASDVSQGEIRVQNEFDQIERDIRKKRLEEKEKGKLQPVKMVEFEKLEPYLHNMQTINNHNLSVATTYMMQLQQMQVDLKREQENAFKAIKKSDHLERKYDITTKRMQDLIDQYRAERDDAVGQNSKLMYEKTIHDDVIAEKDIIIHSKINQIAGLEENIRIKEEEIQHFKQLNIQIQKEYETINDYSKGIQLELESAKYKADTLEQTSQKNEKLFEQFKNQLQAEIQQKRDQYLLESRLRSSIEKQNAGLLEKIASLEDKFKGISALNEKIEVESKKIKERNLSLEDGYKTYYKEELQDIYEKNVGKITNLENLLSIEQGKNADLTSEINGLKSSLKQAEASRDFYIQENIDAENQILQVRQEKSSYLDQFRVLKSQYEKTISDLQQTVKKSQLDIYQASEETKSLKMNMQAYEDRITYLLEIQEIMSLSNDSAFYKIITDLKYRGVNNFTKEEFKKIKEQAMQEHAQAESKREASFREYKSKRNMEDQFLHNLDNTKDTYKQEDNLEAEWNQLLYKLDTVSSKQDNITRLQQIR